MDFLTILFVAVAVVWGAWWLWAFTAAWVYRSRLARTYLNHFELAGQVSELPDEVQALIATLGDVGYEPITAAMTLDDRLVVVLYEDSDKTVAEIVDFTDVKGTERFAVEITSVLEDDRGVLSTSNIATQSASEEELRQAFVDASPVELVRHHHTALGYLRHRGLERETVARHSALSSRADWASRSLERIRTAPWRTVLVWAQDASGGYPASSGPLADNPVMIERLAAMLGNDKTSH